MRASKSSSSGTGHRLATRKRRVTGTAINEPTERSIWMQNSPQHSTANSHYQTVYPQQYPIAGAGNYARFPSAPVSGVPVNAAGGVAGGGAAVEGPASSTSYAALRAQLLQSSGIASPVLASAPTAVKAANTATVSSSKASKTAGTLQQQLQRLQQQQQQQLQQQQQQQQRLLDPNTPPPPTYSEQMQAAYVNYMQQQRQYEQQQQHLLQQLYETFPQMPFSGFPEGSNTRTPANAAVAAAAASADIVGRPAAAAAASAQQSQQPQQSNVPFYTAQQHYGFLQRQQDNILRDQQHVMHQHYNPNEPPKTIQMYGMAVPETSVLSSSPFSPASQVSHVNFSSGNVNYTF